MKINDINEVEVSDGISVIYFYTPLCGVCKVALEMTEVLAKTFETGYFVKVNLNMYKQLAIKYEIEQVPCLVVVEDNQVIDKTYNFSSITKLYDKLKATIK